MKQATNLLGPSHMNDSTVSTFDSIYIKNSITKPNNAANKYMD